VCVCVCVCVYIYIYICVCVCVCEFYIKTIKSLKRRVRSPSYDGIFPPNKTALI